MNATTDKEYKCYVEKCRRQRDKMRSLLTNIDEKRDLIFKPDNLVPSG